MQIKNFEILTCRGSISINGDVLNVLLKKFSFQYKFQNFNKR